MTRPVTLIACLYRQRGTRADDLNPLTVLLSGEIDRHTLGASGSPGVVGLLFNLRIVLRIER